MDLFGAALQNLATPPVLFFLLGLLAARVGSDLELPPALSKGLSLLLILAIGFKGGVALGHVGGGLRPLPLIGLALGLTALTTLLAFALLKLMGRRLPAVDRAAISAHYGSVSVATFAAASGFLQARGIPLDGSLLALMAAMEMPGIVLAVALGRRAGAKGEIPWRELLTGAAPMLLLGSLLIGLATRDRGMASLAPLVKDLFPGILSLFLLDMGLVAGRRLSDFRDAGPSLLAFGVLMPLLGGALGLGAAWMVGLDAAGRTLVAILAGSASYIAAPAAVRQALPEARLSLCLGLSLGITFPFNVLVGIPLWHALSRALGA